MKRSYFCIILVMATLLSAARAYGGSSPANKECANRRRYLHKVKSVSYERPSSCKCSPKRCLEIFTYTNGRNTVQVLWM